MLSCMRIGGAVNHGRNSRSILCSTAGALATAKTNLYSLGKIHPPIAWQQIWFDNFKVAIHDLCLNAGSHHQKDETRDNVIFFAACDGPF